MIRTIVVAVCAFAALISVACAQGTLPRRAGAVAEQYPGVDVAYTSVTDPAGRRMRMIVTKPRASRGPLPTVFVAGWLSCDSIEAPANARDASLLVFRRLAQTPGIALVRMDKPGVGDSQGDCEQTDFNAELAAYRAAFRAMRQMPFVDRNRVFVFGVSNGGGWAPLVAEGAPVAGYISMGGWARTWFEHMLDIERRRRELGGEDPAAVSRAMVLVSRFYSRFLIEGETPSAIFARDRALQAIWDGPPTHLYGRPVAYYQQLQALDLAQAWSRVRVPVLVLYGERDWIMSRADASAIADAVNHASPGRAAFVQLPNTGHTFEHVTTWEASLAGRAGPFDPRGADTVIDWLRARTGSSPR